MIIDKENLKEPDWSKYSVNQIDFYSNAERHDLICRCKLMQIYQNFIIARENLIFSDERNSYGDLLEDEGDKECFQKIFVQNALLYYNFCVDLSWVLIYLYCLPVNEDNFNISNEQVIKAEKIVDYTFIKEYLKAQKEHAVVGLKNDLESLLTTIKEFWEKIDKKTSFRNDYNYIKHQGAYDILGINPKIFFKFKGIETNIDIIESRKFDISEMTNMCVEFNNSFIEYMDKIIEIVIDPSNVKELYNFSEIGNNILKNSKKDTIAPSIDIILG